MYRRTATCLLVVAAAVLLLATSAVSAHRPPRPVLPPLLLGGGGGDAGTWGSFGRSRTAGRPPRGGTWELGARRLGQRGSLDNPPSPKHGMAHTVWAPDPPPPPSPVSE